MPQLIPDGIVFEAEGAGAVIRQPGAAIRIGSPLEEGQGVAMRRFHNWRCRLGQSQPLQYPGIPDQAVDGFERQVAVVRQMSGKIVGTQLAFRILAVLCQIVFPLLQQIHIFPYKGQTVRRIRQRRHQNDAVAAFLHRHLIFPVRRPIRLPVDKGIGAHVMGGEIVLPFLGAGKPEHRTQHRRQQLRIIFEVHRRRRIGDIDGGGAAVGEAFLGDVEQLPVRVECQLVPSHDLTVGE